MTDLFRSQAFTAPKPQRKRRGESGVSSTRRWRKEWPGGAGAARRVDANPVFGWAQVTGSQNISGTASIGVTSEMLLHNFFAAKEMTSPRFVRYSAHVRLDVSGSDIPHPDALKALIAAQHDKVIATHEQTALSESGIEHLRLLITKLRRMRLGRKS
ncbi:MAG: hypothetical protein WBW53_00340 [Terriglobales bacterium]